MNQKSPKDPEWILILTIKLLYTYFWMTLPTGDLIWLAPIWLAFSKSSQIVQPTSNHLKNVKKRNIFMVQKKNDAKFGFGWVLVWLGPIEPGFHRFCMSRLPGHQVSCQAWCNCMTAEGSCGHSPSHSVEFAVWSQTALLYHIGHDRAVDLFPLMLHIFSSGSVLAPFVATSRQSNWFQFFRSVDFLNQALCQLHQAKANMAGWVWTSM